MRLREFGAKARGSQVAGFTQPLAEKCAHLSQKNLFSARPANGNPSTEANGNYVGRNFAITLRRFHPFKHSLIKLKTCHVEWRSSEEVNAPIMTLERHISLQNFSLLVTVFPPMHNSF